jgi:hypothetical protein
MRVAKVVVTKSMFMEMLSGRIGPAAQFGHRLVPHDEIPVDATLRYIWHTPEVDGVTVLIEHSTFDELPEGASLTDAPELVPSYTMQALDPETCAELDAKWEAEHGD